MARPPRKSSVHSSSKKKGKSKSNVKLYVLLIFVAGVLALYLGGLIAQLTRPATSTDGWVYTKQPVDYSPAQCIYYSTSTASGPQYVILSFGVEVVAFILVNMAMKGKKDLHDERGFNKSERGTYGTSGWMEKDEIGEHFDVLPVEKTTGTIFGYLDDDLNKIVSLPLDSRLNKHVAIYGSSGSGKSRSFVRNQIIQCAARGESIIITDPKGEMYADAATFLKNYGYNVKVFNLVDPKRSDSWNCLKEVTSDPDQIELLAQTFADIVIKNTMEGGKADHFWDNAEMGLLKALILYVVLDKNRDDNHKNIGEVYRMLTNKSETELNSMFDALPKTHPALKPWNIFNQSSESVRGNVIVGLGSRIQVFQSPDIENITKYDEIDLETPAKEKCAYFLIMSDQNSTLNFLSSLFFSFLFIRLVKYADVYGKGGKCDVPVNFILDEFPNIGQIPDFTKKLSTIRSRDLRVDVIFQNIAQLQNRYPNGLWQEIIGNCDTQLFLGCTDPETAKFISERTGEMTVEVNSQSIKKDAMTVIQYQPQYNETSSVGKRAVLTPDEVLRFPSDHALVILRGQKVLNVKKYDFSNHPASKDFIPTPIKDHTPEWRKLCDEAEAQEKKLQEQLNAAPEKNPIFKKVDLSRADEDDEMLPKPIPRKDKQSEQAVAATAANTATNTSPAAVPDEKPQPKPITIDNPNTRGGSPRPYTASPCSKGLSAQEERQADIQKFKTLYANSTSIAIAEGSNKSSEVPLDF